MYRWFWKCGRFFFGGQMHNGPFRGIFRGGGGLFDPYIVLSVASAGSETLLSWHQQYVSKGKMSAVSQTHAADVVSTVSQTLAADVVSTVSQTVLMPYRGCIRQRWYKYGHADLWTFFTQSWFTLWIVKLTVSFYRDTILNKACIMNVWVSETVKKN
jgi:hypothetical protein